MRETKALTMAFGISLATRLDHVSAEPVREDLMMTAGSEQALPACPVTGAQPSSSFSWVSGIFGAR